MPYGKDVPKDHSEFGGGPGLIDPVLRADRAGLREYELLREIYAHNPGGGGPEDGTDPLTDDPALTDLFTRPTHPGTDEAAPE